MVKSESEDDDVIFVSSHDIQPNPVAAKQLKDVIDVENTARAIIPKAADLTTRTIQRITDEKQIIVDVERMLEIFDANLKVMPFGSATYGFSGSDTNFNICLVSDGNETFHKSNSFN